MGIVPRFDTFIHMSAGILLCVNGIGRILLAKSLIPVNLCGQGDSVYPLHIIGRQQLHDRRLPVRP
jgi:hypothetical protein